MVGVAIHHPLSPNHTKIVSLSDFVVLAVRFVPVTSLPAIYRMQKVYVMCADRYQQNAPSSWVDKLTSCRVQSFAYMAIVWVNPSVYAGTANQKVSFDNR